MNTILKRTTAALLLGCASLAHGAPTDPAVIRQAVRETVHETVRAEGAAASGKRPGVSVAPVRAGASSNAEAIWAPRVGLPGEHEDDNCLLSFGLGGTLGGGSGNTFSSRALGRTQIWRGQ